MAVYTRLCFPELSTSGTVRKPSHFLSSPRTAAAAATDAVVDETVLATAVSGAQR